MLAYLRLVLTIPLFLLFTACSTDPTVANGGAPELVAKAQASLQELYRVTPEALTLKSRAKAIVVFPDTSKAGLIVGAEGGK